MEVSKKRKSRAKGIAETYIHIKNVPFELSIEKVQVYFEEHAQKWARKKFKKTVVVKITVEEGSLKVWVLVSGMAIFEFVSSYGSFRSSIDQIVSDAKEFSEYVIERFESDQHIQNSAITRAERRLGVPGKIQRFYRSFDKLNSDDINNNERQEEIKRLQEEFVKILELLDNEEDKILFSEDVTGGNDFLPEVNRLYTLNKNDSDPIPELPRNIPLLGQYRHDDEGT